MLTALSLLHDALGRRSVTRRHLPSPVLQHVGRAWLRRVVLRGERARPNDVTVVVGVRDRADYRLANALRSLRDQTHPAELIRILVVDFGSMPANARLVEAMCAEHHADYVRVDDVSVWSRSRCLNVGLRLADTKFVVTTDVDVLFSRRYLSDAIRALDASSPSVVCSAMLDLPETSAEVLERAARSGEELQLVTWRRRCRPRHGWESHPSICASYTALYHAVRGFDEYYEVWGAEDDDLMRRFTCLGLERKSPGPQSFYLHQWHPDADRGVGAEFTERNRAHLARSHSILRNDRRWGLGANG